MTKITSIDIRGIPYTISYVSAEELEDPLYKGPELTIHGDCNSLERHIRILKTLDSDKMFATLLHEVIHGIWATDGRSEEWSEKREESLTVAMECGIVSTMPKLIEAYKGK